MGGRTRTSGAIIFEWDGEWDDGDEEVKSVYRSSSGNVWVSIGKVGNNNNTSNIYNETMSMAERWAYFTKWNEK